MKPKIYILAATQQLYYPSRATLSPSINKHLIPNLFKCIKFFRYSLLNNALQTMHFLSTTHESEIPQDNLLQYPLDIRRIHQLNHVALLLYYRP